MARKRIAIIGAGPIGLEAALLARLRGHNVDVFEQGHIAEHVRSWGHVRLFSPFVLNSSPWGRETLAEQTLPDDSAFLTGQEFYQQYLLPISQHPLLAECIHQSTSVLGVSRTGHWKMDEIGKPTRAQSPFRLLIRSESDKETSHEADVVIDCSGTYSQHNWLGAGGLPAPGERECSDRIAYHLCDVAGVDSIRYANRNILVAGSGYSAATAVVELARLATEAPETRITWLTRSNQPLPLRSIENDSLSERDTLTSAANTLATQSEGPVRWLSGRTISKLAPGEESTVRVTVQEPDGTTAALNADCILALVGYRPDRLLYEELQVHECYATQGPIRLAAALLGETSGDCLSQPPAGPDLLRNPEPDFFILGAKSYGRSSHFLLKTGHSQIETVLDGIVGAEN